MSIYYILWYVSSHCSALAPVHSGVHQGSVFGHILFAMYIRPLSVIIDSHSTMYLSFSDDLQLHMSASVMKCLSYFTLRIHALAITSLWQLRTCLKLLTTGYNSCFSPPKNMYLHNPRSLSIIGSAQINFEHIVMNFSSTLDYNLYMNANVSIFLRNATLNCVIWHLLAYSWLVQQLIHLYFQLQCQEWTTVAHCCLVLLMNLHP